MYDADIVAAAMEVPAVTVNGRVFTGTILSYEEFLPFQEHYDMFIAGELDGIHQVAFARDYFEAVMGRRKWFWQRDPVDEIMQHQNMFGILAYFFVCQIRAMAFGMSLNIKTEREKTKTPG